MKHLIMTAAAILITGNALADSPSLFNKSSDPLKKLGSAFRQHSTTTPKINPNDITMGYAGQDVSNKKPVTFA